MKGMFDLRTVQATRFNVGEWNGREDEAVDAANMIYTALYEAAPEDIDPDTLAEIMRSAWETWGSEETLPDLTEEDVRKYVLMEYSSRFTKKKW